MAPGVHDLETADAANPALEDNRYEEVLEVRVFVEGTDH